MHLSSDCTKFPGLRNCVSLSSVHQMPSPTTGIHTYNFDVDKCLAGLFNRMCAGGAIWWMLVR